MTKAIIEIIMMALRIFIKDREVLKEASIELKQSMQRYDNIARLPAQVRKEHVEARRRAREKFNKG